MKVLAIELLGFNVDRLDEKGLALILGGPKPMLENPIPDGLPNRVELWKVGAIGGLRFEEKLDTIGWSYEGVKLDEFVLNGSGLKEKLEEKILLGGDNLAFLGHSGIRDSGDINFSMPSLLSITNGRVDSSGDFNVFSLLAVLSESSKSLLLCSPGITSYNRKLNTYNWLY